MIDSWNPKGEKRRILVVDDDPTNAKLAAGICRIGGFDVRQCTHPREALAVARDWRPELIVLDVVMPELDGSELCVLLKSDPATADIQVLFVSATEGVGFTPLGEFCGGADYLLKPYTPVKLQHTIHRILGRAGAVACRP